jgi:transposase-like protein
MTCETCKVACKRFGVNRNGTLRFRCPQCRKTFSEPRKVSRGKHDSPTEKALAILNLFIEGTSVRSTERLTGVHRDTILKVLVVAGEKCEKLMGRLIVNVPVKDVECDEIWGFIQKKEGHKGPEEAHDNSIGDAYCFVAIERNTKLVLNFALDGATRPRLRFSSKDFALRLPTIASRSPRWIQALRSGHRDTLGIASASLNSSRSTARTRKAAKPLQPV